MYTYLPPGVYRYLSSEDGSTCPVCKHSVLPESFVEEQIGALLVRRQETGRRLRRRRRRYRHRHRHRHGRYRDEGEEVPISPASSSSGGVMNRFHAWLARDYDDDQSPGYQQDEEPLGSLASNSQIQRPHQLASQIRVDNQKKAMILREGDDGEEGYGFVGYTC